MGWRRAVLEVVRLVVSQVVVACREAFREEVRQLVHCWAGLVVHLEVHLGLLEVDREA